MVIYNCEPLISFVACSYVSAVICSCTPPPAVSPSFSCNPSPCSCTPPAALREGVQLNFPCSCTTLFPPPAVAAVHSLCLHWPCSVSGEAARNTSSSSLSEFEPRGGCCDWRRSSSRRPRRGSSSPRRVRLLALSPAAAAQSIVQHPRTRAISTHQPEVRWFQRWAKWYHFVYARRKLNQTVGKNRAGWFPSRIGKKQWVVYFLMHYLDIVTSPQCWSWTLSIKTSLLHGNVNKIDLRERKAAS